MLCLAYYVEFDIAEIETLWLLRIKIWGVCFTSIFSCNGWMDCRDTFHAVLCFCNKRNKAEYEANWLISVQIINS